MSAGYPEGLTYAPNFLSEEASTALAAALDAAEWDQTLKRRVQHFGYRYDYRARSVEADAYLGPLPDWLAAIGQRLVCEGYFHRPPDQVIANEYWPGQGISAHVDCVPCFGESIISLSLLSACEMIFRNPYAVDRRTIMLEPGALLKMEGPARYQWTHEIPARLADTVDGERRLRGRRISLTFRNVTLADE